MVEVLGIAGAIVLLFIISGFRVINEYERGVVLTLGKFDGVKDPGLKWIVPIIQTMMKVDLRIITLDVPTQDVITKDNVTVRVNAVVYFRVMEADKAVLKALNFFQATSQIAQTTLRSILGESELDELLAEREMINHRLQEIIDKHSDVWGVKVSMVEIKDVLLPDSMQRAMAKQAEADRERRAKIIAADGELQAAYKLGEAAGIMAENPISVQLRYLQTLVEVAAENNSTTLFPIPMELVTFMQRVVEGAADGK